MPVRVGINGFGRIGRNVFRAAQAADADVEWVAVNDLTDKETLAHLLRYDSILGPYPGTIELDDDGLVVDGKPIRVLAETDPEELGWGDLGVDVVLESTGFFTKRNDAAKHLSAGAKKVVISAPASDEDITVVLGVNFDLYDKNSHDVISNASCTTNCLAPFAKVIHEAVGINYGLDDDDPRLHGRPEPPGRSAQGSAPRPRRRDEPRADVDRGREGRRPRPARAQRPPARLRRSRARPDRLDGRPDVRVREGHDGAKRSTRPSKRPPRAGRSRASSSTRRTRSSRATSRATRTRRSSTGC